MFFEGNDTQDLQAELNHVTARRYLEEGFTQNLFKRQDDISVVKNNFHNSLTLIRSVLNSEKVDSFPTGRIVKEVFLLRNIRRRIRNPFRDEENVEQKDFEKMKNLLSVYDSILASAKKTIGSWGGEIIGVYLPTKPRVIRTAKSSHVELNAIRDISNTCV